MEDRNALYQQFIKRFPLESLGSMTLEQYTDLHRSNSFCYWIEFKTRYLGSIAGGSSFKFGIYRYANKPISDKVQFDGQYAWYKWLNVDTAEDAFKIVHSAIVEIAEAASKGDFATVEKNDVFGDAVKWKLAFLYSGQQILPIYVKRILAPIAEKNGYTNASKASVYELNKYLYDLKDPSEGIFEYSDKIGGWGENDNDVDDAIDKEFMDSNYYDEITNALRDKKSIILQGAPGTGKTYAIPEIVARLCAADVDLTDRKQVMDAFGRLVAEKRVVFTTFHQSMD